MWTPGMKENRLQELSWKEDRTTVPSSKRGTFCSSLRGFQCCYTLKTSLYSNVKAFPAEKRI